MDPSACRRFLRDPFSRFVQTAGVRHFPRDRGKGCGNASASVVFSASLFSRSGTAFAGLFPLKYSRSNAMNTHCVRRKSRSRKTGRPATTVATSESRRKFSEIFTCSQACDARERNVWNPPKEDNIDKRTRRQTLLRQHLFVAMVVSAVAAVLIFRQVGID